MHDPKRFAELVAILEHMTAEELQDEKTVALILPELIDCAPPEIVVDVFFSMAAAGVFPAPEAINPVTGHPEFTAEQIAEFFGISVDELEARYQVFNRRVGWEAPSLEHIH
jgi:hypothetical protein